MKFIFSVIRKKKGKVFTNGNILEMLTLLTIIFEWVSEKIAEDKAITLNEAMDIVLKGIKDGSKKLYWLKYEYGIKNIKLGKE